jgi:hypothetical protein
VTDGANDDKAIFIVVLLLVYLGLPHHHHLLLSPHTPARFLIMEMTPQAMGPPSTENDDEFVVVQ